MSECPKCFRKVWNNEWQNHVMNCKIKKKKRPQRKRLTAEEAIAKQTAIFDAAHGKGPDRAIGGEHFDVAEFDDEAEDGRLSCEFCRRHFNPERIAHHEEICYNVHGPGKRDRQQFMSAADMRLKDTEFLQWKTNRRDVSALKPKSRWRERHHSLQNTALQGKLIDLFKAAGLALAELPRPITHWYEDGRPCTPEPNPRMSAAARELTDKVYGGQFASKAGYLCETGEAMMFQPGLRVKAKDGKGDEDVAAAAASTAAVLAAPAKKKKGGGKGGVEDDERVVAAAKAAGDSGGAVEDGRRLGEVSYIGRVDGLPQGFWIGVTWRGPHGKGDGRGPSGMRYFKCAPGHGSFIRPSCLERLPLTAEEIEAKAKANALKHMTKAERAAAKRKMLEREKKKAKKAKELEAKEKALLAERKAKAKAGKGAGAAAAPADDGREECGFCHRRFKCDRIARHEQVCAAKAAALKGKGATAKGAKGKGKAKGPAGSGAAAAKAKKGGGHKPAQADSPPPDPSPSKKKKPTAAEVEAARAAARARAAAGEKREPTAEERAAEAQRQAAAAAAKKAAAASSTSPGSKENSGGASPNIARGGGARGAQALKGKGKKQKQSRQVGAGALAVSGQGTRSAAADAANKKAREQSINSSVQFLEKMYGRAPGSGAQGGSGKFASGGGGNRLGSSPEKAQRSPRYVSSGGTLGGGKPKAAGGAGGGRKGKAGGKKAGGGGKAVSDAERMRQARLARFG